VVTASNTSTTTPVYCKLGASATVNDQLIAPSSWFAFTTGANTQLSCITASGTATVNMSGGTGLPTGAGGGGGGGGSGSNASVGTVPGSLPGSATYLGMNVGGTFTGLTGSVNGLKVDGSAVTQPISGTVTVGSGLISINGNVNAAQVAPWSTRTQDGAGNAITSDARGSARPLAIEVLDAAGNQVTSFGGANPSVSATGASPPGSATYLGMSQAGVLAALTGVSGSLNVNVTNLVGLGQAANTGSTPVTLSSDQLKAAGTACTGACVLAVQGIAGGTALNVAVTNLNPNNQQIMASSTPVVIASDQAYLGVSHGWTPVRLAALSNTATTIKTSGGQLGKVYCANPNTSFAYLQVYNALIGSITVGSSPTPTQSYGIPPTNASGYVMDLVGDQYGVAISVAATTTASGGTAPTIALDCNVSYN